MEEQEEQGTTFACVGGNDAPAPAASAARPKVSSLALQACPTCRAAAVLATNGGATASYVYAIGGI
jgi:hypothetical protein